MVQMSMRQEHVPDRVEVGQFEIPDTGARVDQHIVVDKHRGGARTRTDSATATKYANSHSEGSLALVLMGSFNLG